MYPAMNGASKYLNEIGGQMERNGKGMGNFGWFITGIGLGTLGGVLFAPKAGNETRTELLANAKDAKEKGAALAKGATAKAGEYVQQGKEVAGQYLEQGKTVTSDRLGNKAYAEGAPQSQTVKSTFDMGSSPPEPGV
jgi:gas vesicle protein